ncbi:MAG: UxaA family hydrolase, partial [Dehalococcoidia bacterium]|nr:UxaA family hydrolase [Dehalococcoidia bacterium]
MEFLGYPRENGQAGTRNYVGIISNVACSSDPATWIANSVSDCIPYTHRQGCGLIPPDEEVVYRTLISLGKNPNLAAVLVVAPDCADSDPDRIANGIAQSGKPVDVCRIHQEGGVMVAVSKGINIARKMASDASRIKRQPVPICKLRQGVECGGSTPLSGPVTNAAQGTALDFVIENGGSGGFSETTEVIGAEHVIAARAVNDAVKQKMLKVVCDYEERLKASGIDLLGANPGRQNIGDGLSSIEEKALGAIHKGGTKPLTEVVGYGEIPEGKGMFFVNTPGNDLQSLTGLAAAGCNVITYSTEGAAPMGFPFVAVIKITARQ